MTTPSTALSAPPSSDSLYELAEQLTQSLQRGEPLDVPALLAANPQHAERLQQILPAIEILADLQGSNRTDAGAPARETMHTVDGVLGDFRINHEIGRGGMGVVYEAHQISLDRRVALKVLPFAGVLDARQLQRFTNEARAAAGLHHPHIVPVYAVGCDRGVHYYAMQYIDGHTLADMIRNMRNSALPPLARGGKGGSRGIQEGVEEVERVEKPTERTNAECGMRNEESTMAAIPHSEFRTPHSLSPRLIAEWGIQIAEALDYAHSVGVVHRDVKPANIMLDGQGRVWITDFGLAQIETDAGLTMTGDIVGTLRYMSPEQALGERGLVDQRTDVYSLGLALYELLTKQPAFGSGNRRELLDRISNDDPIPPRRIDPAIPVELETIVQKATEKDPAARYITARDLADDLRRFLHEQPIKARPATPLDRLRKWSRRNRAVVGSAFAALSLTVVILAASTVWVTKERDAARGAESRERQQSDAARNSAQAAREQAAIASQKQNDAENAQQLAEARRRESQDILNSGLDVVENMLTRVADGLANQPQTEDIRKELLEKALAFYERFVREESSDPLVRFKKAEALERMAWIHQLRQQSANAVIRFRQSIEIYAALCDQFPDNPTYAVRLATTLGHLGNVLRHVPGGDVDEPSELAERGYEISRSLFSQFPEDLTVRTQFASHCANLCWSEMQYRPGHECRFERALELIQLSYQIFAQLQNAHPENAGYHGELAGICGTLVRALIGARRPVEKIEAKIREACHHARSACLLSGAARGSREQLAGVLCYAAEVLEVRCGHIEDAEAHLNEAAEIYRELAKDFPFQYRQQSAVQTLQRGRFFWRHGRISEATRQTEEGVSVSEAIAQLRDGPADARQRLICARMQLSVLRASEQPVAESLNSIREALPPFIELKRVDATSYMAAHNLAASCGALARNHARAGRLDESENAFRLALELRRDELLLFAPAGAKPSDYPQAGLWTHLPVEFGTIPSQRWCFIFDSLDLAELLSEMGRHDDARSVCSEPLAAAEYLSDFFPDATEPRQLLERLRKALRRYEYLKSEP